MRPYIVQPEDESNVYLWRIINHLTRFMVVPRKTTILIILNVKILPLVQN